MARKSRAKYRKGQLVPSLASFVSYLDGYESRTGTRHRALFYLRSGSPPLAWAFLQGMPFSVIANAIRHGRLWYAIKKGPSS